MDGAYGMGRRATCSSSKVLHIPPLGEQSFFAIQWEGLQVAVNFFRSMDGRIDWLMVFSIKTNSKESIAWISQLLIFIEKSIFYGICDS